MSTDTRNFLNALFDHWPITIFLPGIILMLAGVIVVTIIWDRHDKSVAEAAAPPPAPAPVSRPLVDNANARTQALPVNGARPPVRLPGRP